MAFVRDLQINIRDGTKDLGPTNQERVRTLDDHPGPALPHAPQKYQTVGEPILIQSITGYTDKNGEYLHSIPYYPNIDARVETKHATQFRAVVDRDQLHLTTQTFQQKYTYISLELGYLVVPTQTDDGYHKTYWRHHITLAYLPAIDDHYFTKLEHDLNRVLREWAASRSDTDLRTHWLQRAFTIPHWRTATKEARRASERLAHENNRFESDNRLKVFFSMPNIQAGRGELGAERLGRGTCMHFACS